MPELPVAHGHGLAQATLGCPQASQRDLADGDDAVDAQVGIVVLAARQTSAGQGDDGGAPHLRIEQRDGARILVPVLDGVALN